MTRSKRENKHTRPISVAAAVGLLAVFSMPASVRSEESGPVNYINIETHRVIKLQEENRFLLQRLKEMKEKAEALQAELLSVRNAYMEREDVIPRTQKEISEQYEEKIKALQLEIKRLKDELAAQEKANEELDIQRSKAQDELGGAAQEKSGLQARIEALQLELTQAQERLAGQQARVAQSAEELTQEQKQQHELQERLAQKEKDYEQRIKDLNDRLGKLKKESESFAGSSAKEVKVLSKDKEDLQARLKEAQQRMSGIESGKEKMAAEAGELKARMEEWQARARGLEAALKTKEEEIAKLQAAKQSATQNVSAVSARSEKQEQEFQAKLTSIEETKNRAAQEHAKALEELKNEIAAKEAQLASLRSNEETNAQALTRKIDELEGRMVFANQQIKEFQEKTNALSQLNSTLDRQLKDAVVKIAALDEQKEALAASSAAASSTAQELADLQGKIDELRGKLQEGELELASAQKENELLLSELLASKDERIKLNNEINDLNKAMFDLKQDQLAGTAAPMQDTLETQETIAQLTRELLTSENIVYEKELIIEGLRSDQERLAKALELAEDNYQMLKAELEGLKVNEVSYNGRDGVLDLELNKLEERVERRLMGR